MIVEIMEIESSDDTSQEIVLRQHPDRTTWNTVGASVQAATPMAPVDRIRVRCPSGGTVLAELTALGNHGRIYAVFCTPSQVAAMVSSGNVPNS
jgi:hypothetical protein